jgi:hypothetical protein
MSAAAVSLDLIIRTSKAEMTWEGPPWLKHGLKTDQNGATEWTLLTIGMSSHGISLNKKLAGDS